MEHLPSDVVDIIYDYKWSMEHYDRWMLVVREVPKYFWCIRKLRMNNQFVSIFYPGFWSELFFQSFDNDFPLSIPEAVTEYDSDDEPVGV